MNQLVECLVAGGGCIHYMSKVKFFRIQLVDLEAGGGGLYTSYVQSKTLQESTSSGGF